MRAAPQFHLPGFFQFVSEDFSAAGTDKGVASPSINHQNQIRETIDQAVSKFLLLVEAPLHFAALGDVHECALIAQDLARAVANGGGGVEANDGGAVFAQQGD